MKTATAHLVSISPYSQSRRISPRAGKETYDAYEARCWRERLHVNSKGFVFIPPMSFKRSLETAAKFLRMRIPGKDKSEYGKHFMAGIIVVDGLELPIKAEACKFEDLLLSARGKKGEMDVSKRMPFIPEWEGLVTYHIVDDTITEEVFEKHLKEAGNFIGLGRFRPEKGGFYGRYQVKEITWETTE